MTITRQQQWRSRHEFELVCDVFREDDLEAPHAGLPVNARSTKSIDVAGPTTSPDYLQAVPPLPERALWLLADSDARPLLIADRLYVARQIRRAKRDLRAAREWRDAMQAA